MFEIYSPSEPLVRRIQEAEQRFYWSQCADALLRKHGLVDCVMRPTESPPRGLPIVLRNTEPAWDLAGHPAVFEGPVAPLVLEALGIEAIDLEIERGEILDQNKASVGQLFFSTFSVRPIPAKGEQRVDACEYLDPDPYWNARRFSVQILKAGSDWTPVAFFRTGAGEEAQPIALTDGRRLVIGVPIFDLIAFVHALPALDAGFYANIANHNPLALERWIVDQVVTLATDNGIEPNRIDQWPGRYRGAFTIRHDYDRPVPAAQFDEMLAFYRANDLKATWFLLVDKMPVPEQIAAILDDGHEIALHTEAPHFDDFRLEVTRFKEKTGLLTAGYTCHGGIGSRGQLGLAQYQWSETLGLIYGEMIGRARSFPHPMLRPACRIPETGRLIIQNTHFSFDISTKPGANQLDVMRRLVPQAIETGQHVVVMNHPDIHWAEFKTLLGELDREGIWNATMAEIAEWANVSKFAYREYPGAVPQIDTVTWRPTPPVPPMPVKTVEEDKRSGGSSSRDLPPEVSAAFAELGNQIEAWFAENSASASPSSIEGTVRMNTVAVPNRVERLLAPIKDHIDVTGNVSVLDVGCGYGGIPIYMSTRYPNWQVIATDTTDRFFQLGAASVDALGLSNIRFRIENILELSDLESFDVVLLSNMLNYLTTREDLERSCANAMRALKPGGWAIIHTPHAWSFREPFTRIPLLHAIPGSLRGHVSKRFGKRASFDDIRLPSYSELKRFVSRHGGDIDRQEPASLANKVGTTHITLWVRKNDRSQGA